MYIKQLKNNVFALRLVCGEEICESLEYVCRIYGITGGTVTGIGTTDSAVIGVYNIAKKSFEGREVNTFCEIASLSGNISVKDRTSIVHLHAVLADGDGKVYAGHLKSAITSATAEIFIHKTSALEKAYDEETGLNLFDFSSSETENELKRYLISKGAYDVGFCRVSENDADGLCFAVSIAVSGDSYFENYSAVNSKADSLSALAEKFLKERGYEAQAVSASCFSTKNDKLQYSPFSHKKAAVLSGLGMIGKNSMFIHKSLKGMVVLASVRTNCVFNSVQIESFDVCKDCNRCKETCPASAVRGNQWYAEMPADGQLDAEKCAAYMRLCSDLNSEKAACANCLKVCPYTGR